MRNTMVPLHADTERGHERLTTRIIRRAQRIAGSLDVRMELIDLLPMALVIRRDVHASQLFGESTASFLQIDDL